MPNALCFTRTFRLGLAALLVGHCLAVPAQAQSAANGTQFDDWTLLCRAEAVNRTACGLVQRISIQETQAFVAEIGFNLVQVDDVERVLMVLQTPTGMALGMRPGFQIDGSDETTALNWMTCTPEACVATLVLEPDTITLLQGGDLMVVGYQPFGTEQLVSFRSSLAGVTAGLAALRGQ